MAEAANTRMTTVIPRAAAAAVADRADGLAIQKVTRVLLRKAGSIEVAAAVAMAEAANTRMTTVIPRVAAAASVAGTAVGSAIQKVTRALRKRVGNIGVAAVAATAGPATTMRTTDVIPRAAVAAVADTAVGLAIRKATHKRRSEVGVIADVVQLA
jgi:hypothetical protein